MESPSSSSSSSSETEMEKSQQQQQLRSQRSMEEEWCSWPKRKSSSGVTLEAAAAPEEEEEEVVVGRTKSLTDEDLDELKGCLDLGFGFSYDDIPELCTTLPALQLCYSMTQTLLDSSSSSSGEFAETPPPPPPPPVASWKFSSPGDSPEEVKARLKYWAQAVACTVRLCS